MSQNQNLPHLPDERPALLSGAHLPAAEVPPLHATLTPRRPDLDLPAAIPPRSRDPHAMIKYGDQTEQMLQDLIGDCHFLMREVAYRCVVQSTEPETRLAFLRSALGCAETGARIAKAIARLRAQPLDQDLRTAILLEANRLIDIGKKRSNPENNDQDVAS